MSTRRRNLIVISPPRSGSSWIASLLRGTCCMGVCREWLTSLIASESKWKFAPPPQGANRAVAFREALVSAASTPNGIWSIKIVTSIVDLLPRALATWGVGDGASSAWLAELFQNPAVLVVRRRDRIAQAVSWWRAFATGSYLREPGVAEAPCPPYEFNALREALTVIEAFNAKLHDLANALAALPGAEVAWCDYEDALADPRRPLQMLAQMSDLDLGSAPVVSDLEIQRDTSSIKIIERFRTALETQDVKPDAEDSQRASTR